MKDIREKILPKTLLVSADHTSNSRNSSSVDMRGFGAVAFFMEVGTITGNGSVTPKIQVSDDDTNWEDAPLADVVYASDETAIPKLATNVNVRFGYAGIRRYVRVATTVVATISASTYSILSVRGEPDMTPTTF
jgi:hypothetical protein